jgi:plastocyanin
MSSTIVAPGGAAAPRPAPPRAPSCAPLRALLRVAALAVLPHAAPAPVAAQQPPGSVLERTPNMINAWPAEPGTVQFNFLHRFTESGPPEHQVSNSPTFLVSAGLPWRATAGFAYATSSTVVAGRPNEWEFFARLMPFGRAAPVADLSLHVGYNLGAASTDAELALARRFGAVRLLAAGRTFASAFRSGERRSAVAGGVNLRVARHLALAGDVATMLERRDGERIAWSAGLQIGIPTTPHSFSLHASNVTTATLQGVSSGVPRTRYGFEYTVPITLARYVPALRRPAPPVAASDAAPGRAVPAGDTVVVDMRQLAYEPARVEVRAGTTVVWTNNAPLAHTVTADDGSFDSGVIDVGRRWAHTFARPGTYAVHCTPHPFMKGVVVVR